MAYLNYIEDFPGLKDLIILEKERITVKNCGMLTGGLYLSYEAGDISYLFQTVSKIDPSYLTLPGPDGKSGILLWVCMFVMTPIGALMGPQLWIRMYSAVDHKSFKVMPFLLCFTAIAYMGSVLTGYSGILLGFGWEL